MAVELQVILKRLTVIWVQVIKLANWVWCLGET